MAGGRKSADATLIAALAGGCTVADAAQASRVSERTTYRRLQDPAFMLLVSGARAAMVDRAVGLLSQMATEASSTLRLLLDGSIPSTTRLGAARAILELRPKIRESEELADRIAEIEARLASESR